jgi:predicted ferric reductase
MTGNTDPLWLTLRATGATSFVLLSAGMVLGMAATTRWRPTGRPRSVTRTLHRNVTLLSVLFLAVHVATAVADRYAGVSITSVVVPFVSARDKLGITLGTIATDLVIAITLTSALRRFIGQRSWRAVHLSSYALWPLALGHSIVSGTDAGSVWLRFVSALCAAIVAGVLVWRFASRRGAATHRAAAAASVRRPPSVPHRHLPRHPLTDHR